VSTAAREWAWLRDRVRRTPRVWRRVVATIVALAVSIVGGAVPAAWAASDIPAALSWIALTDSRGISVWSYGMSLDGGGLTSPGKLVWSFPTELLWQIYRAMVVFAIWFIDWVMGFTWLGWIATPVLALSAALRAVVAQLGLGPLFLTILAAVAGMAIIRGRFALGLFEVLMGCVVAALAVGGLSNPVGLVTGDSGYIMRARDLGIELSAGLAHNGDTTGSADKLRTQIGQTLADTFVRTPHALVNYGRPIAGDRCESVYNDALRQSAKETDSSYVRDKVSGCDGSMGVVAANPNAGMAMSAFVLTPAALLVLGFALLLCGALLMAAARVLYESLKLVVTLVTGVLPGSGRGSLWQGIGNLVMALATMTFTIVFLTGYLLVLQAVFGNSGSGGVPVMATFVLVDVLIVIGAILFWRARKRLQEAAARLAALLATRPGGGAPSKLPPAQHGGGLATAQNMVQRRLLSRSLRTVAAGSLTGGDHAGDDAKWVGAGTAGSTTTSAFTRLTTVPRRGGGTSDPGPTTTGPGGPSAPTGPAGGPPAGGPPAGGPPAGGPPAGDDGGDERSPAAILSRQLATNMVKKTAKGLLVRAAVHSVAAASSGGLSTVVSAADAARTAHQLNIARRVVVDARLAQAAITAALSTTPSRSPAAGSVMAPASPSAGYEQVHSSGQTILVPQPTSSRSGSGAQLPSRPTPTPTPTPSGRERPTPGTGPRPVPGQTMPPTGQQPIRPAPGTGPRPVPGQTMPPTGQQPTRPAPGTVARPAPPAESAEQLHAHLRAYRGGRRRRDGA